MFSHFRKILACGMAVTAITVMSCLPAMSAQLVPRKKLVQLGWDQPTTKYLHNNWQKLDKTAPFDGITFEARFADDARTVTCYSIMVKRRWNQAKFRKTLDDLKDVRFTRLTDNYIRVVSPLAHLDWFDDAAWEAAIANVADIAWLAKQAKGANVKGISFDTETYNARQYRWRDDSPHSFEETSIQARKRGAQMMKAIAAQYPDITIWALWLFSKNLVRGQAQAKLPADDYGLWPAFVNGWLDELPPQAKLVDGMEDAYYYTRLEDYFPTYAALRGVNSPIIRRALAPEHQLKYQTQVSVSFGVYVDAFLNRPNDANRLERLRQNLTIALDTADDMVWLYNEQVKWWEMGGETRGEWAPNGRFTQSAAKRPGRGRLAETAFPGITRAVNLARDPWTTVQALLDESSPSLVSSLVNGSFAQGGGKNIPGWWDWIKNPARGVIERDTAVSRTGQDGSLRLSALETGALVQTVKVQPGQLYVVNGWRRHQGRGDSGVRIRWATGKGTWNNLESDSMAYTLADRAEGEWQPFQVIVQVPSGAELMRLLLGAANQPGAQDSVWYDDVRVLRINS